MSESSNGNWKNYLLIILTGMLVFMAKYVFTEVQKIAVIQTQYEFILQNLIEIKAEQTRVRLALEKKQLIEETNKHGFK